MAGGATAARVYADRVEAVLVQRTRLRGQPPVADLFGDLAPDSTLMRSDAHRPLSANLEAIASYIELTDVVVDVGGGAGRISLPLALRCKELINVDPSKAMGAGFEANAKAAGVMNVRFIASDWPMASPPIGSVALVNHVTYMTRDIVPFISALEEAGHRRVIITVNSPAPPARQQALYELFYDEPETIVPGHAELVNVLWEMGILPDVRVLPSGSNPPPLAPTRELAISGAISRFGGEQWGLWPLGMELEQRLRRLLEERFDELFSEVDDQFAPRWWVTGKEVLMTWRPDIDRI